jgi:regulator of protease activity HflC (stomatin/prohibitin superfamily)
MKLTIIRDMGLVCVDGRGHDELDLSSVPAEVHAVQWDGSSGEIEYVSNEVPNEAITALPSWAESIATERKAVIDAEIAEEEKAKAYEESPEGKADAARTKRDGLISETDWWASTDLTMTAEQTAYRQALRDITDQAGFPESIDWPTKP